MKKLFQLFLFLLLSTLGFASSAQTRDELVSAAAERERQHINAERAALEAAFDVEEDACYKKFFVNSCLNAIKPRRREAMADLKFREVALNEQERRQKAAEQIRKTEEKSSPEAERQAAERRATALEDSKAREERTRQKASDRLDLKQNEAVNAAGTAVRNQGAKERAQARADKQAASAKEARIYKDKQQEAQERKATREQKLREQTKPAAKPLPAPG